ncbi:short-chain dehydrogenase [Flavobacterium palustre]|uniref:Short-chain dehydrogenase n=1 Tax=Flavobacterium palustre TaxID=1476463 RepID=A0ABQ1HCM8_9FLAO|nr:SDR family NAD(P)-dependent oxidoreductase [Flavobacterium palustre]GGA69759.1 short-chain dehydrogenase [Flavobacterium palustre]
MNTKLYTLITGSSEGFGKALAIECAKRKMNLILVSLPNSGLSQLTESIIQNYKVDVVPIEKDLSIEENCVSLFKEVEQMNLSVNILINNVGLGSTMFFKEGSIDFYQKQVKLNVMVATLLSSLFLEMLKTHQPSHILNVSSLSCFFYLAKKQVYGATKSYVYSFSKSLRAELKSDHINVSVICPGGMNTNPTTIMTNQSNHWLARQSIMNPDKVAAIAIRELLNQKEIIIPGFMNKLFLLIDKLLPDFIIKMIANNHVNKFKSYNIGNKNHGQQLISQASQP